MADDESRRASLTALVNGVVFSLIPLLVMLPNPLCNISLHMTNSPTRIKCGVVRTPLDIEA